MTRADGASTFRASPSAYDGHVGRYARELARKLIDFAGVRAPDRVVDVGCGTGLLTAELADVVGAASVAAVDPSPQFVDASRARVPGADVRLATAEHLPLADASVDRALAQLVVNFMSDAAAGVAEMRRVTRSGGVVAAAVWDYAGEMTLLRRFWDAAVALDSSALDRDEGVCMHHCDPRSLGALWEQAGLVTVAVDELWVSTHYVSFDALWEPFAAGVAPSGAYAASLPPPLRATLREEFFRRLGSPPGAFQLTARAWAVRGTVP